MKLKILSLVCVMLVVLAFGGCDGSVSMDSIAHNLTSYEIEANLDYQNKTLTASMKVNYHNTSPADFDNVKFHLYPNAFREESKVYKAVSETQKVRAYPNGFSEGGININRVAANGENVDFVLEGEDKNILNVPIKAGVKSGGWTQIEIDFDLVIPNCNHRFGYGENTLNLGNWYPIACVYQEGGFVTDGYSSNGDPFYSEVANYLVKITYPSNLVMASVGEFVEETEQGESTTSVYSARVVRDFALVFSENFEIITQQVDDVVVSYYYFEDKAPAKSLQASVEALNTFEELFGQYPYKHLRVVKADFLQGGMEYPTLVYVASDIDVEADYRNTIVHEIAHQWWYGVVGNNECEYAWIDEGLAEYSTALFYDKNPQYERNSEQVFSEALSSYLLFCDVYRDVYDELDTSMNRNLHKFSTETEYVYLTYVKGVLMFDSIADVIGEQKMQKALKKFYEDNMFKVVTPSELISAIESVSHKKIAGFVMSWLDGSVVLESLA